MSECKFKVGDKVRILPRKDGQEKQFPNYVDDMLDYIGEVDTVVFVGARDHILLNNTKSDDWDYQWHEDWLELATPRKKRILK